MRRILFLLGGLEVASTTGCSQTNYSRLLLTPRKVVHVVHNCWVQFGKPDLFRKQLKS